MPFSVFGVRWLLRRLGIYPNAYYNYLKHRKADYHARKEQIKDHIQAIYHEHGGINGYRQMRVYLERRGIRLSALTVHKYMNRKSKIAPQPWQAITQRFCSIGICKG